MNEEGIVMAYIGPGAGLASIGALLALIGWGFYKEES